MNKFQMKQRESLIKQSLNYVVNDGKVYDSETGEYIGDRFQHQLLTPIIKDDNGYVSKVNFIYTNENKTSLKQHTEHNGGFVFALFESGVSILDKYKTLTKPDLARLIFLATYTHYDTGRLQKGDGTVLKSDAIHDMVRLSKYRCKEFIQRLIDNNVVTVSDKKEIFMSKEHFVKGSVRNTNVNINYTRLFKRTIRDLFSKATTREIVHLSTIYMALPYVNLYWNLVSYNPDEKDYTLVQPMDTKMLAIKLGYSSYNKLIQTLNKLKIDDLPVFTYVYDAHDRRKKNVIVNPDAIYAGNDSRQLDVIKLLFKPSNQ